MLLPSLPEAGRNMKIFLHLHAIAASLFLSTGSVTWISKIVLEVVKDGCSWHNRKQDLPWLTPTESFVLLVFFFFFYAIWNPDTEDPESIWQPHYTSKACPNFLLSSHSAILDWCYHLWACHLMLTKWSLLFYIHIPGRRRGKAKGKCLSSLFPFKEQSWKLYPVTWLTFHWPECHGTTVSKEDWERLWEFCLFFKQGTLPPWKKEIENGSAGKEEKEWKESTLHRQISVTATACSWSPDHLNLHPLLCPLDPLKEIWPYCAPI